MLWMIIGTIVTAFFGLALFIHFLRKDQFEDDEMVKYQLFREDNPEE